MYGVHAPNLFGKCGLHVIVIIPCTVCVLEVRQDDFILVGRLGAEHALPIATCCLTFQAKQQELLDINHFLEEPLTHDLIKHFKEQHPG